MDSLLAEYFPILVFLVIAVGLATVMIVASFVAARQRPDSEKLSPYECGFEPFVHQAQAQRRLRRVKRHREPTV